MSDEIVVDDPNDEDLFGTDIHYKEMYSTVALNGEATFTIFAHTVEQTKTGIKNYKTKLNADLKESGLPKDDSQLVFSTKDSEEFPGCVELTVFLKRLATVKVMKISIPDAKDQLPD